MACSSRSNGLRCLLYTSPSPRDGHLSIRRQRQDVYKRQLKDRLAGVVRGMLDGRSNAYVEAMNGMLQQVKRAALSLIHISEPTRRTPLYSSAASGCV